MPDDLRVLAGQVGELRGEFRTFRETVGDSIDRLITKVDEHLDLDNDRFGQLALERAERTGAQNAKQEHHHYVKERIGFLRGLAVAIAGGLSGSVITLLSSTFGRH